MNRETLEWINPQRVRRGFCALPKAAIDLVVADDGHVMWGINYFHSQGGFGFAPLPKWHCDAPTRHEAIAAAAASIREHAGKYLDPRVAKWLDDITGAQLELFA